MIQYEAPMILVLPTDCCYQATAVNGYILSCITLFDQLMNTFAQREMSFSPGFLLTVSLIKTSRIIRIFYRCRSRQLGYKAASHPKPGRRHHCADARAAYSYG